MWAAIAQAVGTIVRELIGLGHKPSRDDIIALAKAIAQDEYMARVIADELDAMIRAADSVKAAFVAKPGEVPVLDIDVELVKP